METASGVYLKITDNSIYSAGSSSLKLIIPMLTLNGEVGINLVDASTFKSVLGYDIDYNPNYYGLSQILSWVSQVYVWRINQKAAIANAYWKATGNKASSSGATSPLSVTTLENVVLAVGHKNPGNWGNKAIRFKPTLKNYSYEVAMNEDEKYVIEQADVANCKDVVTYVVGDTEVDFFGGFVIYDTTGSSVIGLLKATDTEGKFDVYKVSAGTVVAKTEIEDHYTAVDKSITTTPVAGVDYYTESGGTYTKCASTLSAWENGVNYYTYDPITKLTGAVGTATLDANNVLKIVLDSPLNSGSYWTAEVIDSNYLDWTLQYATYEDNEASDIVEYEFSLDPNSEDYDYIDDADFGDLFLYNKGGLSAAKTDLFTWQTLDNGDNGADAASIDATEIDTSVLADIDANVLLMNGFNESVSAVNTIATAAAAKKIHAFVDLPLLNYRDAEVWAKKITQSEYIALGGRADKVEVSGGYIYQYPSVKYGYIYAKMMENQGNLRYPPAGYTTGLCPVTELEKLDYASYGNELKTNRINYLTTSSLGSCMWENRTTYALTSDLSFIYCVFIVDDICDQILDLERQFNFRFTSAGNMSLQQMNLDRILSSFQEAGFIYSYGIQMPSDATSREYTIVITIQLAKDSEVIHVDVVLEA